MHVGEKELDEMKTEKEEKNMFYRNELDTTAILIKERGKKILLLCNCRSVWYHLHLLSPKM